MSGDNLRVVMLAKGWPGYLDAAFRALAARGVELTVVHPESMNNTAFESNARDYAKFLAVPLTHRSTGHGIMPANKELTAQVVALKPDVVISHSWEVAAYRHIMRALPKGTLRVLWMDNILRGTARQWVGMKASRIYLQPLFDAVMVPSDRTEQFARRLGFPASAVIRGCTPADTNLFSTPPVSGEDLAKRARFVAAMRLVHHKGADVLAAAYRDYRRRSDDPWNLAIAGLGEMAGEFEGIEGVEMLGFKQPEELADEMRRSSCLINPSRMEPYAVVLQEGAASGLPIIATDFMGAAPTMVQDGYNGWIIEGGRADLLTEAMLRMSEAPAERLEEMSATSLAFAKRLSPSGWARNVHEEFARRLPALRA